MQFEEEFFEGPFLRAQLNTTARKQDTYFAAKDGKPVFVKGPYETKSDAETNNFVNQIKVALDPSTPVLTGTVVALLVNTSFLDTKLGVRTSWENGKPGYFAYYPDLTRDRVEDEVPTDTMFSKKWSDPVPVVDFSKLARCTRPEYSPKWEKSIYTLDPLVGVQFMKHMLLSWIIGTSADIPFRNFIVREGKCYQVDNERIFDHHWNLPQTIVCSNSSKSSKLAAEFAKRAWDGYLKQFTETVSANLVAFPVEVPAKALEIMIGRANHIRTLDGLLEVLTQPYGTCLRKRARVE